MKPELTMMANDLLQKLVRAGALVADAELRHMRLLLIHAELVTPAPGQTPPAVGWLYYVEVGAEDQHHAHFRAYAGVEVVHDLCLRFKDANGNDVANVAPLEECRGIDVRAENERLVVARAFVRSSPEGHEAWEDFINGCRPRSEDAAAQLPQ